MRDSIERPESPASGAGWQLTGRQVLLGFCAFFGIVFAVNGYFLFSALATHTGVVSVEPYRKGLAYNERIAASDRQAARGWTDEITVASDGGVAVRVKDATGKAVSGLKLVGTIGRPSTSRGEIGLAFREQSEGLYVASAGAKRDGGAWLVAIEAHEGLADAEPEYRARRRLWLAQ